MKFLEPEEFWGEMERLASLLKRNTEVAISMTNENTMTSVSVGGRLLGEEITCHYTGQTRHYLSDQ